MEKPEAHGLPVKGSVDEEKMGAAHSTWAKFARHAGYGRIPKPNASKASHSAGKRASSAARDRSPQEPPTHTGVRTTNTTAQRPIPPIPKTALTAGGIPLLKVKPANDTRVAWPTQANRTPGSNIRRFIPRNMFCGRSR